MSEDASKRVVAEARRQKLLARGKDRLQQITHGQTQSELGVVKQSGWSSSKLQQLWVLAYRG